MHTSSVSQSSVRVLEPPSLEEHKKQALKWRLAQVVYFVALSILSSFLALNFFRQGWFIGIVVNVLGSFATGVFIYETTKRKIERHQKWAQIAELFPSTDTSLPLHKRLAEAQLLYYKNQFEKLDAEYREKIRLGRVHSNPNAILDADYLEQQVAWSKICQAFFSALKDDPSPQTSELSTYCRCRFQATTIRAEQDKVAQHIPGYNFFVEFFRTQRKMTTQEVFTTSIQDLSKLLFNPQNVITAS
jgi:hypothetical protein